MIATSPDYQTEWEKSYEHRDNFVFYPHEEVIRFVSKYGRKRVGLNEFEDRREWLGRVPKLLDLGCGIGRHVVYAHEMQMEGFGIDLSSHAVEIAKEWALSVGAPADRIVQGDVRALPWEEGFFDLIVSHGVLDSMPFEVAQKAVEEVHRVLKPGGCFYCDLISGDNIHHAREYAGEEIVKTAHEEGTVQSYFNFGKIETLIKPWFSLLEANLIRKENVQTGSYSSRYHLILSPNR